VVSLAAVVSAPEPRELSIVIPAFNEARRIAEPLRRIDAFLHASGLRAELVVVDDGSSDGTDAAVRALAPELHVPVEVVVSRPNRGKGWAVRLGMRHARGRAVLMTDADLSTPIEELEKFLACIGNGVQVAIGSRRTSGAVIEQHQPFLRESMGRVFTALTRLLVVRVSDVTCGFKLFTRDAADAIFPRLTLDDWSFDAELLYVARRLGLEMAEVPVRWRDAPGTKVRRLRDAVQSLVGLGRILANGARGRYDRP
jgi:dolichyl-phosphate beta-glucosyltransferase